MGRVRVAGEFAVKDKLAQNTMSDPLQDLVRIPRRAMPRLEELFVHPPPLVPIWGVV
jgi:hypothetical protein